MKLRPPQRGKERIPYRVIELALSTGKPLKTFLKSWIFEISPLAFFNNSKSLRQSSCLGTTKKVHSKMAAARLERCLMSTVRLRFKIPRKAFSPSDWRVMQTNKSPRNGKLFSRSKTFPTLQRQGGGVDSHPRKKVPLIRNDTDWNERQMPCVCVYLCNDKNKQLCPKTFGAFTHPRLLGNQRGGKMGRKDGAIEMVEWVCGNRKLAGDVESQSGKFLELPAAAALRIVAEGEEKVYSQVLMTNIAASNRSKLFLCWFISSGVLKLRDV